jgi:hypothetical protein
MKTIELKKAMGSMLFNGLMTLCLAVAIGAGLQGCEEIFNNNDKPTPEEQARMDSIKVARILRYGDPNVIITDKNGNPIPGPNGGSLRASDIPTNPNIKFPILDSIAGMTKTLELPAPEKSQILYGISHNGVLAALLLNQLEYLYDENDKSMGAYGTLTAVNFIFKEDLPDGKSREYRVWGHEFNNKSGLFVSERLYGDPNDKGDDENFYVKEGSRINIYNFHGNRLLGWLEKGSKPDTYKRTMYKFELDEKGNEIIDKIIGETVEEVPVGFIFVEQPKDDPSQSLQY